MMWKERHREHFQGGSQGCDLTARAHDFLWISQRHFQSSSSPSASYLSAVVPSSCPARSLSPGWVGSCLPMQQVGKCISANAAEKEDCKGALSFLQSQLLQLPELVQGQDRTGVHDRSRQDIELPLSFISWLRFQISPSPAKEEGGDPAPHPLSSPSHLLIPLGMALAIR